MAAVTQMVTVHQRGLATVTETRSKPKDKDSLTTKRAFSLLPSYTGKAEEYDTWRFQLTQFLAEDSYFAAFLDWIETSA